jgi:hypothetical protein
MGPNKVVIKFNDGTVKKGSTPDFLPNKACFHLNSQNETVETIEIEALKAVFFVKDVEGNKDYNETYQDVIQGGGKKVQVEFNDGEIIVGYVLGYSPDRQGFNMTPADLNSNNERVFVVTSATTSVTFL